MIDNKFKVKKVVGQGGSSKVFAASDDQGNQYAIKILRKDKKYSYERGSSMLKKEHGILNKLTEHPNILNSFYGNPDGVMKNGGKTEDIMYTILELAENGTLSRYVRTTGSIEEDLVKFMFLQLSDAVRFIHSNNLAHLDLKLENILLDKFYNIKLADLGVAFQGSDSTLGKHRRGTMYYMAPEVADLKKGDVYDAQKADIYSLGVCLYVLLVGEFPERSFIDRQSLSTNDSDKYDVEISETDSHKHSTEKGWKSLSDPVKQLLISMLSSIPGERPSIEDVQNSQWFEHIDYEWSQQTLFEEMCHRKNFISKFPLKKKDLSLK